MGAFGHGSGARPSPGAATYERLLAIGLVCGFPDVEAVLAERDRALLTICDPGRVWIRPNVMGA